MERTFEVTNARESDLTIHCEDSVFHVHRALLSRASPFWNRMLKNESISDTIVLEGDSPVALNYVLEALYYAEMPSTQESGGNSTYCYGGLKEDWWEHFKVVETLLGKYQLFDTVLKHRIISKIYSDVFFRRE